jgi:hypothetical protein
MLTDLLLLLVNVVVQAKPHQSSTENSRTEIPASISSEVTAE